MHRIHLGTVTGPPPTRFSPHQRGRPLALTAAQLQEHVLILGRTGSGKSRLLNQIVREHLRQRIALVLIDPDSDLINDLLAHVTRQDLLARGTRKLLRRVHVLEPSPFMSFRYDPFRFVLPQPVHPELLPSVRAAWLHAKVHQVASILQRNNGDVDFEGMPRLQRILGDVLYAVGTLVQGRHLPLADAAVLLEIHSEAGQKVYRKVARFLPRAVRADFEALAQMRRVEDVRRETESALNRFRLIFGPVLQSVFGSSGGDPSFNLYEVIQRGEVVLVSLRDTPFFSGDQARAVANLMIYDTMVTAMLTPQERRKPVTLMIDEAAEYVTPDLATMLRRGRKYLLSLVLAAQSLQSFRKENADYRPLVLGMPGTVISMNQRYPDDLDLLARVLFTGRLDFKERLQEVERDGGVEWLTQEEHSYSDQKANNWTDATGWQRSNSLTHSAGDTQTESTGWQDGTSRQEQLSSSESRGATRGRGLSRGNSESPILKDSRVLDLLHLASRQESEQSGDSESSSSGRSLSNGVNRSVSGGSALARQRSTARGAVAGTSGTHSEGGSESTGHSVAYRHAQVRKVVRELQRTGQLEMAVADQLMQFAQKLCLLERRQAVALVGNETVEMEAADVPDPFCSQKSIVRAAELAKRRLIELRPYLFVPDLTAEESERRLTDFLGDVADATEAAEDGETSREQPAHDGPDLL